MLITLWAEDVWIFMPFGIVLNCPSVQMQVRALGYHHIVVEDVASGDVRMTKGNLVIVSRNTTPTSREHTGGLR